MVELSLDELSPDIIASVLFGCNLGAFNLKLDDIRVSIVYNLGHNQW